MKAGKRTWRTRHSMLTAAVLRLFRGNRRAAECWLECPNPDLHFATPRSVVDAGLTEQVLDHIRVVHARVWEPDRVEMLQELALELPGEEFCMLCDWLNDLNQQLGGAPRGERAPGETNT